MLKVCTFVFGPFQENTYVLYDDTLQCVIIDPGCSNTSEEEALTNFIAQNNLTPILLLNTHCHIDHVMGNAFVASTYNLLPQYNLAEEALLEAAPMFAANYGFSMIPSPVAEVHLDEGDIVKFGNTELEIMYLPGHSPGSIAFYNYDSKIIIGGDVLFYGSIGRTDLPMGNHNQLITSIKKNLFRLPDDFIVYSGHGPTTTIGYEKATNPFLQ